MNNIENTVTKQIYNAAKETHISINKMEQDLNLKQGFICSRKYSKTFPFETLILIARYLNKPIWYFEDSLKEDIFKYINEYFMK